MTTAREPPVAARMDGIEPFHVMALLQRARELERQGRSIVHLEIGEPDFQPPPSVVEAAMEAVVTGGGGYTPALGLAALREAIATGDPGAPAVDPTRVAVTPGASGALLLALGTAIGPGDEVLMADPGYPCNRHFVRMFEGRAVSLPCGPETAYQPTAEMIAQHWGPHTRAVLIASPSNPTGTVIADSELARIATEVDARGGVLIVDEIYRRLGYEGVLTSALAHTDRAFVIGSFSKYFAMTGWRIGWLVAPGPWMDAVERLAQNVFLAPSTPGQHAALAALSPGLAEEFERRRRLFAERRDYLVPALRALGFGVETEPVGAFYVYADCSAFTDDSFAFCHGLLEDAGVAITPGRDFGVFRADRHVRFSYASDLESLREGVSRLVRFLHR